MTNSRNSIDPPIVMPPHDPYEISVDSPECRFLCAALDDMRLQEGAVRSPEFFSGGFRFSDEVPRDLLKSDKHVLPLVTLLRRLWGYRASLVVGRPREDLAPYWERARELAPHWAGFADDRCSPEMADYVNGPVQEHCEQILKDLDRLDAQLCHSPSAT
jgi:hypothetical protein